MVVFIVELWDGTRFNLVSHPDGVEWLVEKLKRDSDVRYYEYC